MVADWKSEKTHALHEVKITQTFELPAQTISSVIHSRSVEELKGIGGPDTIGGLLHTDLQRGISSSEATNDYEERIQTYGRNVYRSVPPKSIWALLWEAYKDVINIVFTVAAVISLVLGILIDNHVIPSNTEDDTGPQWVEGVAIMVVVVIIVLVTSINNWSKDRQFRKLNEARTDVLVKVVRGGVDSEIHVSKLLVGDIAKIEQGDAIPADGIYISGFNLVMDESSITGESDGVPKSESAPFIISGSSVTEGSGKMLVMQVGSRSEWGAMMEELQHEEEETPLQENLEKLALLIGKIALVAASAVFLVLLIWWIATEAAHKPWEWGNIVDIVGFFIVSVTIFVVAVPEGLPLAVTISLAYSVVQMLKDNNLVRHLAACETMGEVTTICSDKTGTLTQNKMTVVEGYISDHHFNAEERLNFPKQSLDWFVASVAVNSKAHLIRTDEGVTEFIGNKTECALLVFNDDKLHYNYKQVRASYEVIDLFDFSSARKRMTTVARQSTSRATVLFMKGAPEVILERSSFFYNMNGEVQEMTTVHRNKFQQDVDNMANKALRTLAIAMKELSSGYTREGVDINELESNVVLLGIVGIEDPLRDGVTKSITDCKGAGITVRMVTGDNVKTATEIATRCGILSAEGLVLEGPEFEKMTDQELEELLPRLQVLARSRPNDKLRLVQLLKAAGEIVAVTGDGTNDALALNEANIGLAMGIAGSSVAKEAADIIILDDNFLSIVKAVLWGRSIYNNIQKFLQFQLTVNLSALVVAVVAALSNYGTPLKALQLLWVNMIMDTLASLALCTERPNPDLLNQKPFGKEGLLSRRLLRNVLCQGLYQITILLIILYAGDAIWRFSSIGEYGVGNPRASLHYTFLFNTFVFFQIFNLLNARRIGDEKNVFGGITQDWVFCAILAGIIVVQVLVVTFGGFVFMTKSLPWDLWLISIGVGAVSLPLRYLFNLIPLSRTSARAYSRL